MKFLIALCLIVGISASGVHAETHAHGKKTKTYHTKKYLKKHRKGLKKKHSMKAAKHVSHVTGAASIPGASEISALVSLPENQGQCGSCWDFSLTKALRSEYMVHQMDPGPLEFNYLLNNCGSGPAMDGCNGGDFSAAASFESAQGPGLNSQNPYHEKTGGCKHLPVRATAVSFAMLGGDQGPTFYDIAYAVGVEHHMLSIDVAAGMGDWENYSDGIYNECSGSADDIDHMINLVGYSCETSVDGQGHCVFDQHGKPVNGDGYLVVQNNWGEDWGTQAANGHGGYMKTRMYGSDGEKCNAIATEALQFEIAAPVPASPTPSPAPEPKKCGGIFCCWFHLWC